MLVVSLSESLSQSSLYSSSSFSFSINLSYNYSINNHYWEMSLENEVELEEGEDGSDYDDKRAESCVWIFTSASLFFF